MQLETQVIKTPDGVEIYLRRFYPLHVEPSKTICWIHGLGEHGGRYEHVAKVLTDRGWTLILPDLRGHGRSGGIQTHVKSFDEYVDDIALIWRFFKLADHHTVLLGHSMGGLVTVRCVQTGRIAPTALVLSSPLLGVKVPVNPLVVMLGKLIVPYVPTMRFSNRIDPKNMTHDVEFVARRRNDKLIIKTVTASWFFAMNKALSSAQSEAERVSLPVLALQGTCDKTTDPEAMAKWWERIRSAEKGMLVLEEHFHELFFEPDWHDTVDLLLNWLEEKST